MKSKMKTNRGAAKRFKKTASGKIKFKRTKMRHILTKKSQGMKRSLRAPGYLDPSDQPLIDRLIPYK